MKKGEQECVHFDEAGHPVNTADFPYDEVDKRLGKCEPMNTEEEQSADMLFKLFDWILEPTPGVSIAQRDQITARVLVLIHATRPGLLGNPSLRELGENFGFEFRKLSLINADIRETFNLHTRSMKSQTAIEAYRARFHRLRNKDAERQNEEKKQPSLL